MAAGEPGRDPRRASAVVATLVRVVGARGCRAHGQRVGAHLDQRAVRQPLRRRPVPAPAGCRARRRPGARSSPRSCRPGRLRRPEPGRGIAARSRRGRADRALRLAVGGARPVRPRPRVTRRSAGRCPAVELDRGEPGRRGRRRRHPALDLRQGCHGRSARDLSQLRTRRARAGRPDGRARRGCGGDLRVRGDRPRRGHLRHPRTEVDRPQHRRIQPTGCRHAPRLRGDRLRHRRDRHAPGARPAHRHTRPRRDRSRQQRGPVGRRAPAGAVDAASDRGDPTSGPAPRHRGSSAAVRVGGHRRRRHRRRGRGDGAAAGARAARHGDHECRGPAWRSSSPCRSGSVSLRQPFRHTWRRGALRWTASTVVDPADQRDGGAAVHSSLRRQSSAPSSGVARALGSFSSSTE